MKKNSYGYHFFLSQGIKKTLDIMKISFIISLIAVISVHASVYSQARLLDLTANHQTVRDLLKVIEKKSDLRFFYNEDFSDLNKTLSLNVKNTKVEEVLNLLFSQTGITYKVLENNIVVITPSSAMQQQKISGIVTDALTGEPIIGGNVVNEGTTIGTTTDGNGKFSLQISKPDAVLIVSYLGYNTERISVNGKSTLEIKLVPDVKKLDEIVVIGYGTAKKSDITGSVKSLTNDNFNDGVAIAPEQLMQGKVAGVNITMQSGEPGANSDVLIRGANSVNHSNAPLYVIDGVPVSFSTNSFAGSDRQTTLANNPLNMINPSDIESINVLKDASATAIYGSRGANGVIIVTTKKGKSGQPSVGYDGSFGISTVRKKLDMLSADDYRQFISDNNIKGWQDGKQSTDWQDQIFRKAITQSHSLSLNGGSDKTNYRASVNYTNQDGIIIASNLEKYTGRININHKALNDRLTLSLNLTNAFLKNHSAPNPEGAGGDGSGGVIRDAVRNDPTYGIYNEDGTYTWHGNLNQNPVEETNNRTDITETYRYMGNGTVDYKFFDFLSANVNIGFTKENVDRYIYLPIAGSLGKATHGFGSQESRSGNSKLLETNLVFNKTFGKQHITALGGYSYQEFVNSSKYMSSSNFISDATSYYSIGGGNKSTWNLSSDHDSNKLISFYGRATYNFDEKYLFTATLRQDGSSRFGANTKWGLFPSAAVAWRISQEEFLKNNNVISNLKLRVGYGITGNQEIGNYGSLAILAPNGQYIFGGNYVTSVGPDQYPNPDLKWESTAQTNLGLDFGIIQNRLSGTIDVYKKTTTNLLLGYTLPQPTEHNSTTLNVGSVENKGIEFELNGVILDKGPVGWEVFGNIAHNENKVVSISNSIWKQEYIPTGWMQVPGFSGYSTGIIAPGYPLNSFYAPLYAGVDANGIQQFNDHTGNVVKTPVQGTLATDDRAILGSWDPKLIYGFGSKLTFQKRLSLDFFFRGSKGANVLNSTLLDLSQKTGVTSALGQDINDAARINIIKESVTDGISNTSTLLYSDKWIQDASFLRLENVTVSYNFNVSAIKYLSGLNVYVTGQNLFVITKYKGFDPEVAGGNDSYKYPKPRTFQIGIRAKF